MRERRVLIQMCILVVAFVVCWFPFWILVTALHICLPACLSPHINTIGTAFQVNNISAFLDQPAIEHST